MILFAISVSFLHSNSNIGSSHSRTYFFFLKFSLQERKQASKQEREKEQEMGCKITKEINYKLNYKIGEGGFASIYQIELLNSSSTSPASSYFSSSSSSFYALKVINIKECLLRKGGYEMLKNEINCLKIIQYHPFISHLKASFHDPINCYLIFELLEGGDLRYYINIEYYFTEKMIAFIASCIGSALHFIHLKGIIHRDIKPENIIFTNKGIPKIIDFGISFLSPHKIENKNNLFSTCCSGTRLYSSPELFTTSHQHGPSLDFWCLGLVLYELIYLHHPFYNHCPSQFILFIQKYLSFYSYKFNLTRFINNEVTQYSFSSKTRNKVILERMNDDDEENCLTSQRVYSIPPCNPWTSISNSLQQQKHHQQQLNSLYENNQQPNPRNNKNNHKINNQNNENDSNGDGDDKDDEKKNEVYEENNQYDKNINVLDSKNKVNLGNSLIETDEIEEFDLLVLPPHLRVPLPQFSAYGDPISLNCYEFLGELLDIRPDRRLGGTEETWNDFIHHEWILSNGINVSELVNAGYANSPLQTCCSSSHIATHPLLTFDKFPYPINSHQNLPPQPNASTVTNKYESPIKLNLHEIKSYNQMKFAQFKTSNPQNKNQNSIQIKDKSNKFQLSSLLSPFKKKHRILPTDCPPNLMELLDSYEYWSDSF